jgi:hypothetical protein
VVSGAGQFDIKINKVVRQDRNVVLAGKMGYWEAQLILSRWEALRLAKAMVLPLIKAVLRF